MRSLILFIVKRQNFTTAFVCFTARAPTRRRDRTENTTPGFPVTDSVIKRKKPDTLPEKNIIVRSFMQANV